MARPGGSVGVSHHPRGWWRGDPGRTWADALAIMIGRP